MAGTLGPIVRRLNQHARRLQQSTLHEMPALVLTNASGADLTAGDVVVLDPVTALAVGHAASAGDPAPLVVLTGGAHGETVKCAGRGYGPVDVTCDTGAVAIGDALVASATAAQARADNAAGVRAVLGVAMTAKAAGASGTVTALL
jgi:hypothetical protein